MSKRTTKNVDLIITANPKSSFAEAIKSIKTNIQFSAVDKDVKVILLTSPAPGDGKSFISANLAAAFAQDEKKVLLMDADFRRGRQQEIFGISKNTADLGYPNLIVHCKRYGINDLDLDNFIYPTKIENVWLLPSGPVPPNPLELLSSDNNHRILDYLKGIYDIIIIDCPPVLGLSDTLVEAQYSDINLLAVTNGRTKQEQLAAAKSAFEKANIPLNGVIINRVNSKGKAYSSYYSDRYYTEEIKTEA
ncbi:CpsD/CapB family tyrosine-protein kinase [Candidatus Saccharibacteria bacterium]|nr:CpsD/CapB family tyrosine-protein kinase [Candidatus Saccharibacteria bacterium]